MTVSRIPGSGIASMTEFVHLHTHSCFSLLDGASTPEALLQRAHELGMHSLALTDHDAVYGAVNFIKAAQGYGIHPILGAELTIAGETSPNHLTLLVQNAAGWSNLCTLITAARHNANKGEALLPQGMLEQHTDGLIALSGCRRGAIAAVLQRPDEALEIAQRYRGWFGPENFFIELQHHRVPHDSARNERLEALAAKVGVGVVATNNVHYACREGHRLQDVLVCIRNNTTLDRADTLLRPNDEYFLKSGEEMAALFPEYPEAIDNTIQIAERCAYTVEFGLQELPVYPMPDGMTAYRYLEALCHEGLNQRHLQASEAVLQQLTHELAVIERSGLSNYFLIVWDIVRFAREQGIRCQGRGSAANSLVAYLLMISPVNPLEHNLVFERFLSDERKAAPDIDIDFDAARREEVIQYVYQRYDHAHAAMACTLVTYRAKSALRDVGKALGMPPEVIDRAAGVVDAFKAADLDASPGFTEVVGARRDGELWRQLVELCAEIDGLPRHVGIHNGGMVVMGAPLSNRLPTEPATMLDRYVVQWDKEALEESGLIKIDVLGLRMISAIAETLEIVEATTGEVLDLDNLTLDDPQVYRKITQAETVGMFQVESRAQAQILPRLRPEHFGDLIIAISLIRPGPVQGGMVNPYLERRLGKPWKHIHPLLQPVLDETLGVIVFQEQVLKTAHALAGFTLGQGEQLRRALGSKRAHEAIEAFREQFVDGALHKGVERALADAVFDSLRAFGGYSFPKSHAASFAVLVYQSAWLKLYYPQAFYCALLNNQPMGFWNPQVIINDAKRHGITVLPIDVNRSQGQCSVEAGAIRLGFNYVKGFGDAAIRRVMDARDAGTFRDLLDFCKRTQLPRRNIERLILIGGFDTSGKKRRALVWALGKLDYRPDTLELVVEEDDLSLPPVTLREVMGVEYELMGLSLRDHVMTFYTKYLKQQRILGSRDLEQVIPGRTVRVAGQCLVHQSPPTAKGYHFITLEDQDGFINVIVRPDVYANYRRVFRESPLLIVKGEVQREGAITNLLAEEAVPLTMIP